MKTSFKEKVVQFLFGAEGINGGDCFTYTYTTLLWGLILWFATFDKLGVPVFVYFILWAALMVWMWGTYLKKKKAEEKAEKEAEAKKAEERAKKAAATKTVSASAEKKETA